MAVLAQARGLEMQAAMEYDVSWGWGADRTALPTPASGVCAAPPLLSASFPTTSEIGDSTDACHELSSDVLASTNELWDYIDCRGASGATDVRNKVGHSLAAVRTRWGRSAHFGGTGCMLPQLKS